MEKPHLIALKSIKLSKEFLKIGIMYIVALLVVGSVLAWSGPSAAPPDPNTPAPINVGATAQTKSGNLTISGSLTSNILYDGNNAGYYIDPNGTSRMGQVTADNTYTHGNENANDYYIRASGKWASQLGGGISNVTMDCYQSSAGGCLNWGSYCRACVNGMCSGYVRTNECSTEGAPI
jgi:hypothetical protein